jgi:hypothetical protein
LAAERPWSAGVRSYRAAVAGPARREQHPAAGDRRDATAAHGVEEQQCGQAAGADQDKVACAQPAAGLKGKLATDIEQPLVPAPALPAGALGRNESGEEWQGPDPSGPGDGGEQHQAHPAQPARLDEVAIGGADRVAVDAFGRDALAAAALDCVVERQDDRTARCEG